MQRLLSEAVWPAGAARDGLRSYVTANLADPGDRLGEVLVVDETGAGDEVYGNAGALRARIAQAGLGFVMAIAKDHPITTGIGTRPAIDYACRPARSGLRWHRCSTGDGAHGPRVYDWTWTSTTDPRSPATRTATRPAAKKPDDGQDWLLIRRSIRTGELAFYRTHFPRPVPLKTLVRVAGSPWRIEDSFAEAKELAALDQHQVQT